MSHAARIQVRISLALDEWRSVGRLADLPLASE